MLDATESSGTAEATTPRQRLTFLEDVAQVLASPRNAAPPAEPLCQAIDPATAAAVEETRQAFFGVRDAGASNRIEQGQLLRKAHAQLAKYGSGTFTAMLLTPRPEGFGFKSATSAYDLMAEAEGQPKRSHKANRNTGTSTPEWSNEPSVPPLNLEGVAPPPEQAERQDGLPNILAGSQQSPRVCTPRRVDEAPLPMNLDDAASPSKSVVEIPDQLPTTLDTSHTHTYVPFGFKGVYIPKADVEGFTTWLQSFSNAALSDQFLAWYHEANPSNEEQSNETSSSIQ